MAISSINEHIVESDQTVKDWLSKWILSEKFNSRSFLDLKLFESKSAVINGSFYPAKSIRNSDRIEAQYTPDEYQDYLSKDASGDDVLIKGGTSVGLPNGSVKRQILKSKSFPSLSTLTEYKPFIAKQLKNLFEDPNYYSRIRNVDGGQSARVDVNDVSVFIWIRSITNAGDNSQQGTWYNVSSCVENVNTFVTKELGTFSFDLAPVRGEYDKLFGWGMDGLVGYESGSVREDVFSVSSMSKYKSRDDNFLVSSDIFFSKVLQENDLVYIRFEGLESERKKEGTRAFGGQDVPGHIYDMIGLIDRVSEGTARNNFIVGVEGRDLMKALIEDGSIFFPAQIGQQIFTDPNSILTKRNLIEQEARHLSAAAFSFKPVHTILKYIFNKFSNMGLVPSSVFNGYGSDVLKDKYKIVTNNSLVDELNDRFLKEERQGVWRIMEMVFDKDAAQRVMSDNSIATDSGSILNAMRKMCQEPFIELSGDTYGDKYYIKVHKMPFDAKGYRGMVFNDVVSEELGDGVNGSNLTTVFEKRGIGKIRAKVATAQKNNVVNKLKQRNIFNGRPALISDLVIDIDEADVISANLDYSNEVYSWYRLIPRGLGVQDDSSSFLLAPVVPLDEYAEVWGNRPYSLEYNYAPAQFIDDSFANKEMKYAEAQAFLDLQFVIQSNAYLPFTRMGRIIINGDRRIKRGMMVYRKATDEVFYVDTVANSRTLNDRTTTITVSRGMVLKYIKGVKKSFGSKIENVSYFDIVNTEIDSNASINNSAFLKNWRVNRNVFNFFLQRRQTSNE